MLVALGWCASGLAMRRGGGLGPFSDPVQRVRDGGRETWLATPLSVAHLRPGPEALRPRLAAGLPFSDAPSVLHIAGGGKSIGRNWEAGQEMAGAAGRGQVMVFETAPVGALSTPAFVYDATVKYHVPEESPSIVTLVVAGLAMSRTWLSAPGDCP